MIEPSERTPAVRPVAGAAHLDEIRTLFREYADGLGIDLSFQDFEHELRELPGEYAPPRGLLLLAIVAGEAAGCVGIRPWEDGAAEMKRLYVRHRFRGLGTGVLLAHEAIAWAKRAGYARLLLDTLPSMTEARGLYVRLGFREIPPYRFNPIEGTRFMELRLI